MNFFHFSDPQKQFLGGLKSPIFSPGPPFVMFAYMFKATFKINCQAQVQVHRKGTGPGADTIILQATHHHSTQLFSPEMSFYCQEKTFHDLP